MAISVQNKDMSDTDLPVNPFVDLEARVDDTSDEEDNGEDDSDSTSFTILRYGMVSYTYESLAREFIDDGPTLKAQLTPWRHIGNVDVDPKGSGWDDVVASLEERFTSEGSGTTHSITEDFSEKRLLDLEITTAIDNITRLPTDDCPLWRIRCKVVGSCIIFQNLSFVPSA